MSRKKRAAEERDAQEHVTTPTETEQKKPPKQEATTKAETQTKPTGRTHRNAHGGRPTRCTPELAEEVASYIREIGFVSVAIGKAGLTSNVHYEWMQKGEEDIAVGHMGSPFAVYATIIKKAQTDFQFEQLRAVQEGEKGWQARAWMLERSDPENYAIRQRVEHSGRVETGAAPVLSPSEYEARKRAILGDRQQVH